MPAAIRISLKKVCEWRRSESTPNAFLIVNFGLYTPNQTTATSKRQQNRQQRSPPSTTPVTSTEGTPGWRTESRKASSVFGGFQIQRRWPAQAAVVDVFTYLCGLNFHVFFQEIVKPFGGAASLGFRMWLIECVADVEAASLESKTQEKTNG